MKKLLFKKFFQKTKQRILKSYLSVNYTPKRFVIPENAKCLCLAPHQDDETIGMGGTLARFNTQFDVVCLTNGAKGFKHLSHDEAVSIRKNEFESAMKVANIENSKILNIEDRALIDGYDIFKELNIENYDYIFIPNIIDQHKDHKAAAVNLFKLLQEKEHKSDLKIALYEVWSPLTFATSCIDISEQIDTKKRMLEEYKSQCEQRSYYDAALGLSKYRGLAKELNFAEAFWIMPFEDYLSTVKDVYTLLSED